MMAMVGPKLSRVMMNGVNLIARQKCYNALEYVIGVVAEAVCCWMGHPETTKAILPVVGFGYTGIFTPLTVKIRSFLKHHKTIKIPVPVRGI